MESFYDFCVKNEKKSLLDEWDSIENEITPKDILPKSNKSVWWKCKHGHKWIAKISSRANGSGCPYCSNKKLLAGYNDLATTNPKLAAEWNYEKNKNLMPTQVMQGSHKKVWWKCEKGHEWIAAINDRKETSCPYCSNKKLLAGYNDLATTNPKLAAEWNYEKNGDLMPAQVMQGSNKKVWWKCEKGHEWVATINSRKSRNCPHCSKEKQTSFPEQAIYFYLSKYISNAKNRYKIDNIEVDIFLPSLNIAIEYDGENWHKNANKDIKKTQNLLNKGINLIRIREPQCPKLNILDFKNVYELKNLTEKELTNAINYIFNTLKVGINPDVNIERDRIFILEQSVSIVKNKSLFNLNPRLSKEWNYDKNGKLTPDLFNCNSTKKVWWKCEKGHEWQATIASRNSGNNCPYCSNKYLLKGYNDLKTLYPQILNEWDYNKNDITPDSIKAGSLKKVWWLCKNGHSYKCSPYHRIKGIACPYCSNRKILVGYNDLQTVHPDLAKEWNYELNDGLLPSQVMQYSNKKVWWKCPNCKKDYLCNIAHRSNGTNCPECSKKKAKENLIKTKTKYRELSRLNQELAKYWDYDKNLNRTPDNTAIGSSYVAYWKCPICGYEWKSIVKDMNKRKNYCLMCKKRSKNG